MALGEISIKMWLRVLLRELASGLALGTLLGKRVSLDCCFLQRHEGDFTYTRRPVASSRSS